jgi:hypothetical protein
MKKGLLLIMLCSVAVFGITQWITPKVTPNTTSGQSETKTENKRLPLYERIAGFSAYLHQLRANPETGEMDYKAINKVRQIANQAIAEKDGENILEWEFLGPNNVGGRTRVLWIDPSNSNHLIAGGVSGGIWVSNDGGGNWQAHTQNTQFVNVAANCIVQGKDGAIYIGTGEYYAGYGYVGSGFPGYGILKSTDNGATFQQVPSTDPGSITSPNSTWASVIELVADPNENIIYAGTPDGIFVSINGGDFVTPNGEPSGADGTVSDMAMTPNGLVHAFTGSRYYHITHSGTGNDITFTYTLKSGTSPGQLPTDAERRVIAVAPSDPNYVYSVTLNNSCLENVYRSTDGGNIWEIIGVGTSGVFDPLDATGQGYCQGNYDLAISVLPTNPNVIFFGGSASTWRWTQTGGWEGITSGYVAETDPNYVHADIHNYYFDPNNPNKMYVVSDGGISVSNNAHQSNIAFSTKNKNYNVTQFYTVSGNWEGSVMGGSQDNGVHLVSYDGQNSLLTGVEVQGGDGGDVEFSQTNLNVMFAGSPSTTGYIGRSSNGGNSFGCFFDDNIDASDDDGDCVMDGDAVWITPFYLWEDMPLFEATGEVKSQFITGTANGKVWLTNQATLLSGTPAWKLAGTLSGSDITAVSISKDGRYAVAGTAEGKLMRVAIGASGNTYTQIPVAATVIGGSGYITSVNFGNTSDVLLVTYAGYGGSGSKIYMCTNFTSATTAAAMDFNSIQGNLPKFPVLSAIVDADNDNRIIAGTDYGVWIYDIAAQTWSPQVTGLGNVPVFEVRQTAMRDLDCHVLYIGSFGRGFWRSTTLTDSGCDTDLPVWSAINPTTSETFNMVVSPMPMVQQATVQVSLPTPADKLSITLFDLQGKQVAQWQKTQQTAGIHQYNIERSNIPSGIYLLNIDADGRQMTKKLVVQ